MAERPEDTNSPPAEKKSRLESAVPPASESEAPPRPTSWPAPSWTLEQLASHGEAVVAWNAAAADRAETPLSFGDCCLWNERVRKAKMKAAKALEAAKTQGGGAAADVGAGEALSSAAAALDGRFRAVAAKWI